MRNRLTPLRSALLLLVPLGPGFGCKSTSITEVRGKTSFGPEFRNFGNNTSDIRYTAIQGVELKMSNDWTAGVSYQRRDLDDGAGDNENLVLFEVGYPVWKKPKLSDGTAHQIQIRELENELRELNLVLASAEASTRPESLPDHRPTEGFQHQNTMKKGEK